MVLVLRWAAGPQKGIPGGQPSAKTHRAPRPDQPDELRNTGDKVPDQPQIRVKRSYACVYMVCINSRPTADCAKRTREILNESETAKA